MTCVLRLVDDKPNLQKVQQQFTLVPYRVTEEGVGGGRVDCLYYDIPLECVDLTRSSPFTNALDFILKTTNIIDLKKSYPQLRIEVDLAVVLGPEEVAKSVSLNMAMYPELASLETTLTFSMYRAD